MLSFKVGTALLLRSLAASFVIPADPAPTLFDLGSNVLQHPAAASPFAHYPRVVSYSIEDAATIQFRIRADESAEEEEVTVTVPPSAERACSGSPSTGLTVNGQPLFSTDQRSVDGFTSLRWSSPDGFSTQPALSAAEPASAWALHCVCLSAPQYMLTSADHDCPEIGYVLNYPLRAPGAPSTYGFSLSYVQSPEPRLFHLSYLVPPNSQHAEPDAQPESLARLAHWSSPLLTPVGENQAAVSAATLFPTFVTSQAALHTVSSFQTVTTPVRQATTTVRQERPAATPAVEAIEPLQAAPQQQILQGEADGEDKPCSVERLKKAALRIQGDLRAALKDAIQRVIHHKECESIAHLELDSSRNETRGISDSGSGVHAPVAEDGAAQRDDQAIRALHITSLIVVVVGCSCVLFVYARRDPRRRVDRAAKREERRNRRLYQAAACKYKWQGILARITGRASIQARTETVHHVEVFEPEDGWTDKTSMDSSVYLGPGGESSVSNEISALRKAHGFVQSILQEGQARPREARGPPAVRHSRSYSDSLNSEKSMLPAYTEKDEMVVVDGQLRSSRRLRHLTPASSIMATSPLNSDCSSDSEKE